MDQLDKKLTEVYTGKVVRKDLLHRIKKGTNVPTFVLEFLLARFCASDDPDEIEAGIMAVLNTLQENYVRPDEANAAQSRVATKGKHRFIDKVHVRYVEKEKRHWAELENFNSRRIAIGERFFKNNERLLEGGIWAEVTVAHNDIEDDNYAFYIEDIRPIQLSKFDYEEFKEKRKKFSRDEWLDILLRTLGLEPSKLSTRVKLHFISRLIPFVETNFNFIELGPRGTGKSYYFSEFSPYSTLISGGQTSKATLFYNNNRKKVGLVGYWDTIAFDEVGGIKIKDPDTIQIMKDFMANGRFSRGVEVIADASFAFVGNLDLSVEQVVNSTEYDLFQPLPKEFDLAVMDRFNFYLPGWEMPKNSSDYLTSQYGFITDYLAEAFHYQTKHDSRYDEVSSRLKMGPSIEGRDEKSAKKTLSGLLKILHPEGSPSDQEFEEYVEYALEARRRVKEQMNKRKPDDEFAKINLSYINAKGEEKIVYCPESKKAVATQEPTRKQIEGEKEAKVSSNKSKQKTKESADIGNKATIKADEIVESEIEELKEKHFTITYGATGFSYENIMAPYFHKAKSVTVEDPYIRAPHQIQNFIRFCEMAINAGTIRKIKLVTSYDRDTNLDEVQSSLEDLKQSLLENDVDLEIDINPNMHDREIRLDNGWVIKIGRGLDIYQKPNNWFEVGNYDMNLRKCLETKVDIYQA